MKSNIVPFPVKDKTRFNYAKARLEATFKKRPAVYLLTLLESPTDANGWIYLTQKEIQARTRLRPETQKKYREQLCRSGVLESYHQAAYQGRVVTRFNPLFFQKLRQDPKWEQEI